MLLDAYNLQSSWTTFETYCAHPLHAHSIVVFHSCIFTGAALPLLEKHLTKQVEKLVKFASIWGSCSNPYDNRNFNYCYV